MSEANAEVPGPSASNSPLKQSEKLTQIKEALPSALPTKEGTDDSVENNGAHGSLQVNGTTVPKTVSESKTDTQPPEQVDSSDRQSTEVDMEKGEEQNVTKPEKTDQGSVGEGSSKGQETSSSGKEENKSSDDRNEEEMEVSQAGEPSSDTLPKETVTSRRRRSSVKTTPTKTPVTPPDSARKRGRSPATETPQSEGRVKRQRKQVEKFQAPTAPAEAPTPTSPSSVRLYDKNATLAVRADGASFFLCRCMNNVFNTNKRFKIRWFEMEQDPDLYRLAYDDKVELECVIGPAHLQRAHRGLFRLVPSELERINQLLKAAERGEDVTKLDPELFKPQTSAPAKPSTSKAVENKVEKTDVVDGGDDTDELEDEEPTPKRKRTRKKPETPKPKAAPKPKAVKGTPRPRASAKVPTKGRSRKPKKVVSIAQAEPSLRRVATLNLARNLSLQRSGSFFNRPSLIRKLSLQKWPTVKTKAKRPKLEPGAKRPPRPPTDPNKKLKHNPRVTVWERDPLFESRVEVPFVSTTMHSRLAIRAVKLNDLAMMKRVYEDTKNVHNVNIVRSLHSDKDMMSYAILSENKPMIQLIRDEEKKMRSRPERPRVLLHTVGTGRYNPRTLPGVKAVRKIQISRGGREGNNALTKDCSREYSPSQEDRVYLALRNNLSFEFIKTLMDLEIFPAYFVYNNICEAVRFGHRKLASQLMEACVKTGGHGFNFMHRESLKLDGDDYSGKLLEVSALKKPEENRRMLPLHCAAVNPNTKYLSTLLSITSNINMEDADKRRPIHYAAACEGTGPLELLIKKGVSLEEGDSKGWTPLIIACITGRADNVKVILNHFKEREEEMAAANPRAKRFGPGGINKPMKNTWCPLHFAVANKRKEVMEVLIENGADVNKNLGANFNRITPLIMVAQEGDLNLVRFFIDHRAKIEKPDKLKRTALIHAVRDGNANVVSYLLNRGADPNVTDSSGNRAIHYAAAYGWYFCLKALLDAGAEPDPPNDWKLTPLGAAFLKGNQGLTKVLIDIPGVNINFQDEEGKTLVHYVLDQGDLTEQILKDVKLLVVEKKADVHLLDKEGRNAFHYLFRRNLIAESDYTYREAESYPALKEAETNILRGITDILLEKGCNPWTRDRHGENVFSIVLNKLDIRRNLDLLEYLMKKGMTLPDLTSVSGLPKKTLLHKLCEDTNNKGNIRILHFICGMKFEGKTGLDLMKSMAKKRDPNSGYTPFLSACSSYSRQSRHYNVTKEEFESNLKRQIEFLKFLIEKLESDVEYEYEKIISKDKKKTVRVTSLKPLLDCAENLGYQAFQMVLQHKANIDFRLDDGSTLLLKTMESGSYEMGKILLDSGADVNIKTEVKGQGEMTPLLVATSHRQTTLLPLLMERGADVKAIRADTKETVLHLAIHHIPTSQVVEVLKGFLGKGVDINAQDQSLHTSLHLAANNSTDSADESKELEHFLLKSGADPFIKDSEQRLPLHYLFVKFGRESDCSAIDPVESYTIFSIAMKYQHLDDPDKYGQTVLHRAAVRGATVCCMLLLQRGCTINAQDKDGNTPLALAVWKKHDSCAITLIQKDADVNSEIITDPWAHIHPDKRKKAEEKNVAVNGPVNNDSSSSSSSSSDSEDMEVDEDIHQIIRTNIGKITEKPAWKLHQRHFPAKWKPGQRGYPVFQGLVINSWQGITFLAMDILEKFGMEYAAAVEIAIVLSKFRFAMKLIEKQLDNERLRVKNEKKQTLVHVLAKTADTRSFCLQKKVLDDLLQERKIGINDQDENGSTAMHFAVLGQHWDLTSYLLNNCKDLDLQIADKFGRTPLALFQWAGSSSYGSTVESTLSTMMMKGAKANILVDYPPTSVLRKGYLPSVDSSEYYRTYSGKRISPLIKAIIDRNTSIIKVLLDRGASPDFPDSEGVTPLMYAVKTGCIEILHLLFNSKFTCEEYKRALDKEHEDFRERRKPLPVPSDSDLFAGCPTVTKDRNINVNAVDHQGRTVVHHLLNALPYGTYTDLTLLKMVRDAGAKLDVKDKTGKTPLNIAMELRAVNMAKGIQQLLGVTKNNWQIPSFRPFAVDDGIAWEGPEVDFIADAEAELKKMEEEEALKRKDEPWCVIDSRLSLPQGEVVMDEELGVPYDILMTKVDVKVGEYGLYNFYKMQVIHDNDKDMDILYNCWGRIGDEGQFQKTPMKSVDEAKEEFAKIFKAKSGNEWKDVKTFENKPRRYRLVDVDYRRKNVQQEVKFDLSSKLPSKLPSYIQDLMTDLSNVSMLRQSLRSTRIDIPFGRLKKDVLLKARDILHDLHGLADKLSDVQSRFTTEHLEEYRELNEQVSELSSEFYYLVPLQGYAYESLEPLRERHQVEQFIDRLTQLLELQYVGGILLGAQHRIKEMNPLDYIYRAIKTRIQMLPQDSQECDAIVRYVFADYASSHPDIEAIYRVDRLGESDRLLETNLDNHMLLWHGSRTSNLLGILSRGLLIAPKDAPMSGMRYGKGIYTADAFAKSLGYCHNDGGGRSKYMLLCESALGKSKCINSSSSLEDYPPEGFDSVIGYGSNVPDPRYTAILPTGAKIPLGPHITNYAPLDERTVKSSIFGYRSYHGSCRSGYNEYIVYKEDQNCLRYIVQFR